MRNLYYSALYNVNWWYRTRKEKAQFAIAWALPKWLVYFASIRLIAHATTGSYSNQVVPELNAMDALKRWECK